jgi:hypothetical protein
MRTIPLQRSLPLHRTHKCATSVLFPKPALRHARQCALEVYGQGSGPLNDLGRTAQKAGSVAWTKLRKGYEVVDDSVKRTASQVNSKYDVTGKAQQAANQVSEQAKVVDTRFGVKRRLRNIQDDLQRKWPIWRKKYAEFSRTLPGQAVFLTFIFFLFRSGIIWKMLNLLFIAWWLAPFLFFVIGKFSPKASDAAARRKAQQEQNRRRQSDFLRNAFFGQQFGQQKQRAPGPSESANRRKYDDSDGGHVIDVEATTIDEH